MFNQDFLSALIGGIFIGLAASGMFWTNGRIMGVSGILGGLLNIKAKNHLWRLLFLLGILIGSLFILKLDFTIMEIPFERGIASAIVGGLLVGIGTTISNGCTSGHGVCGISRFSARSIVATIIFITLGILSVAIFNSLIGGI